MPSPRLVIAFTPINSVENPNIKASGFEAGHRVYLDTLSVCLASARRFNPDLEMALATTSAPPEPHAAVLEGLGVEIDLVPFEHRPPVGFAPAFAASLYMLDVLARSTDDTFFVDPDVLCVAALEPLAAYLRGRTGVLQLDSHPDESINGLTLRQAGVSYRDLGSDLSPRHYGGEFYYVEAARTERVAERIERAWRLSLDQHRRGLPHFTTEEHVLSYVLAAEDPLDVAGFVSRVWTAHRYRRVPADPGALTLWHLPSEKERGFRALVGPSRDRASWFWRADRDEFVRRAGSLVGLSRRRPRRLALDAAGAGMNALHALRRPVPGSTSIEETGT